MSKVFIVSFSMSDGYAPPSLSTSFHDTLEEAKVSFEDCLDSIGEDPAVVELLEFNTESKDQFRRDYFDGDYDEVLERRELAG